MNSRLPANIALFACIAINCEGQAPHPLVDLTFQPADNFQGEGYGPAVVQPDGRILMGMRFRTARPNEKGVLESVHIEEMRRLHPDGSLDASFRPIPGIGPAVVAPNGDIIVAAEQLTSSEPALLIRADRHGNVLWSADYGLGPGFGRARGVALQADGKVLVYGHGGIRRYHSIGVEPSGGGAAFGLLDSEFYFWLPGFDVVWSAIPLRDGKILVSYDVSGENSWKNRIVRLHPDGREDATFVPLERNTGPGRTMALLPDGKILTTARGDSQAGAPGVVRLYSNGAIDPAYHAPSHHPDTMVLQPDGRLVIGGYLGGKPGPVLLLARLLPDGALDASFGCPLCTSRNEDGEGVLDLTIGPDGNVIATGFFFVPGTSLYGVVRLKTAPPVPLVQFSAASQDVHENAGRATIRVARTGNTNVTSTVAYVTIGVTAAPWVDFIPGIGVLVFRAGEPEKSFQVRILSDRRREGVETVSLKLFAPSHNTRIGAIGRSMLRIIDSTP